MAHVFETTLFSAWFYRYKCYYENINLSNVPDIPEEEKDELTRLITVGKDNFIQKVRELNLDITKFKLVDPETGNKVTFVNNSDGDTEVNFYSATGAVLSFNDEHNNIWFNRDQNFDNETNTNNLVLGIDAFKSGVYTNVTGLNTSINPDVSSDIIIINGTHPTLDTIDKSIILNTTGNVSEINNTIALNSSIIPETVTGGLYLNGSSKGLFDEVVVNETAINCQGEGSNTFSISAPSLYIQDFTSAITEKRIMTLDETGKVVLSDDYYNKTEIENIVEENLVDPRRLMHIEPSSSPSGFKYVIGYPFTEVGPNFLPQRANFQMWGLYQQQGQDIGTTKSRAVFVNNWGQLYTDDTFDDNFTQVPFSVFGGVIGGFVGGLFGASSSIAGSLSKPKFDLFADNLPFEKLSGDNLKVPDDFKKVQMKGVKENLNKFDDEYDAPDRWEDDPEDPGNDREDPDWISRQSGNLVINPNTGELEAQDRISRGFYFLDGCWYAADNTPGTADLTDKFLSFDNYGLGKITSIPIVLNTKTSSTSNMANHGLSHIFFGRSDNNNNLQRMSVQDFFRTTNFRIFNQFDNTLEFDFDATSNVMKVICENPNGDRQPTTMVINDDFDKLYSPINLPVEEDLTSALIYDGTSREIKCIGKNKLQEVLGGGGDFAELTDATLVNKDNLRVYSSHYGSMGNPSGTNNIMMGFEINSFIGTRNILIGQGLLLNISSSNNSYNTVVGNMSARDPKRLYMTSIFGYANLVAGIDEPNQLIEYSTILGTRNRMYAPTHRDDIVLGDSIYMQKPTSGSTTSLENIAVGYSLNTQFGERNTFIGRRINTASSRFSDTIMLGGNNAVSAGVYTDAILIGNQHSSSRLASNNITIGNSTSYYTLQLPSNVNTRSENRKTRASAPDARVLVINTDGKVWSLPYSEFSGGGGGDYSTITDTSLTNKDNLRVYSSHYGTDLGDPNGTENLMIGESIDSFTGNKNVLVGRDMFSSLTSSSSSDNVVLGSGNAKGITRLNKSFIGGVDSFGTSSSGVVNNVVVIGPDHNAYAPTTSHTTCIGNGNHLRAPTFGTTSSTYSIAIGSGIDAKLQTQNIFLGGLSDMSACQFNRALILGYENSCDAGTYLNMIVLGNGHAASSLKGNGVVIGNTSNYHTLELPYKLNTETVNQKTKSSAPNARFMLINDDGKVFSTPWDSVTADYSTITDNSLTNKTNNLRVYSSHTAGGMGQPDGTNNVIMGVNISSYHGSYNVLLGRSIFDNVGSSTSNSYNTIVGSLLGTRPSRIYASAIFGYDNLGTVVSEPDQFISHCTISGMYNRMYGPDHLYDILQGYANYMYKPSSGSTTSRENIVMGYTIRTQFVERNTFIGTRFNFASSRFTDTIMIGGNNAALSGTITDAILIGNYHTNNKLISNNISIGCSDSYNTMMLPPKLNTLAANQKTKSTSANAKFAIINNDGKLWTLPYSEVVFKEDLVEENNFTHIITRNNSDGPKATPHMIAWEKMYNEWGVENYGRYVEPDGGSDGSLILAPFSHDYTDTSTVENSGVTYNNLVLGRMNMMGDTIYTGFVADRETYDNTIVGNYNLYNPLGSRGIRTFTILGYNNCSRIKLYETYPEYDDVEDAVIIGNHNFNNSRLPKNGSIVIGNYHDSYIPANDTGYISNCIVIGGGRKNTSSVLGLHANTISENTIFLGNVTHTKVFCPAIYNQTGSGSYIMVNANGNIVRSSSSRRYKENIQNVDSEKMDELFDKINVRVFNRIGQNETEIGYIAEEVPEEFQRIDNGKVEDIKYFEIAATTVKVVQTLKTRVQELEDENKALKDRLAKIEQLLGIN